MPLNEMGKIKSLVDELKGIPGAMNATLRQEIFQNIKKKKLQIKFLEEYPETLFTDSGNLIPIIGNNDNSSSGTPSKQEVSDIDANQASRINYLPHETMGEIKSVYGTYIEMAFHNFYLTMHHIYAVVFGEDIMEEAQKKLTRTRATPTLQNTSPSTLPMNEPYGALCSSELKKQNLNKKNTSRNWSSNISHFSKQ